MSSHTDTHMHTAHLSHTPLTNARFMVKTFLTHVLKAPIPRDLVDSGSQAGRWAMKLGCPARGGLSARAQVPKGPPPSRG